MSGTRHAVSNTKNVGKFLSFLPTKYLAHFYSARNARIASAVLATAIPSVHPSVCPSVCLSVRHTTVLCQNDRLLLPTCSVLAKSVTVSVAV